MMIDLKLKHLIPLISFVEKAESDSFAEGCSQSPSVSWLKLGERVCAVCWNRRPTNRNGSFTLVRNGYCFGCIWFRGAWFINLVPAGLIP